MFFNKNANLIVNKYNNFCNSKLFVFKSIFIAFLLVLFSTSFVFANNLDLSQGKIMSKDNDYYFKIPMSWDNYITAKRVSSDGQNYYDRIDFYYVPKDIGNKPAKFLSLYTYKKADYKNEKTSILTTNDYVFAVDKETIANPYDSVNDRIIFSRFLLEIATQNFVSSKINFLDEVSGSSSSGSLTVNGVKAKNKPLLYNGELYLPIRETAEKLGYTVEWQYKTKTILLEKDEYSISIPTRTMKAVNINGTLFFPINFYMQKLDVNLSVDSNNNIKIRG